MDAGRRAKNKYKAKKTMGADGRMYDSKLEEKRAYELQLMEKAGEIDNLKFQQTFPLIIKNDDDEEMLICKYIADFTYLRAGVPVVEDVKGIRTPVFNLKAKLFKAIYGFPITIYPERKRRGKVKSS